MEEHLKEKIMALSGEFWQEQPDSSYVRWIETELIKSRELRERDHETWKATNRALMSAEARAIELETQLAPLQQQFDDWAEQNRRAKAWAAAWKRKAKMLRDWYFYAEKHIFRSQELSQRVNELEENIADAVADAERFKAENARLRAALEAVEWTCEFEFDREDPEEAYYFSYTWCQWCRQEHDKGHAPDCQRQKALEAQP